jgi:hypothetical protein
MTWTKLSDDFTDDCWTLSDAAFRLHVEGLTWSNRKLLDLHLPADDVRRFKRPEAVQELLDGGWWRRDGEHYVIQHHGAYQRPRAAVIAQQTANTENGKKGGRPRKPPRETFRPETESVSESVSKGSSGLAVDSTVSTLTETHSLSESKTERDRTGQGSKTQPTTQVEPTEQSWPPIRRCRVCRDVLDPKLPDDTHPNCEVAA